MTKPIVAAFDGNWYLNRAHHVLDVNDPEVGRKLAYLVTSMIMKDALAVRAAHVLVAWDGPSVFRYKLNPRYKINRRGGTKDKKDGTLGEDKTKTSNPVYEHLPLVQEYMDKAGIPWVQLKKYEADDILACVARLGSKGYRVYLMTKDKDSYQVLTKNVSLYIADRKIDGKNKPYVLTYSMAEEAKGIPCSRMVDYQTLLGDSIDNVVGLPGIGPVAAKKIVLKFESLNAWIESLEGEELAKVTAHMERLRLNRKLVKLDRKCYDPDPSHMVIPKHKPQGYPKSFAAYVDFLYPKSKGLFG